MIQRGTYLQDSLKEKIIVRWPDKLMPLNIYIAPFRWYEKSKQKDASVYGMFVMEAFKLWSEATSGKFTYKIVYNYNDSNINISWRRVNRESLGMCHSRSTNEGYIYSAELEIGISDGILHSQYQNINEVKHTIIHEVGHAIGLGHSSNKDDIMYVPHQYGSINVSPRDIHSAKWLYNLEPGYNYTALLPQWGLPANATIDDLIWIYENQDKLDQLQEEFKEPQSEDTSDKKILDIDEQQKFLATKNLLNIATQNIKVKPQIFKKPIQQGGTNSNPFLS